MDAAVEQAIDDLYQSDPGMVERIEDAFDAIARHAQSSRYRRRAFTNPPGYLYVVLAPAGQDDWAIIWRMHPERDDTVHIRYVGRNIFG